MTKLALGLAAALATTALAALPASAQQWTTDNGLYGTLEAGPAWFDIDVNNVNVDTDLGFAVGGAVGVAPGGPLRAELDVSYHQANLNEGGVDGDVYAWTYMINGIFDFETQDPNFQPHVGLGLGGTTVGIDASTFLGSGDESGMGFAYNAQAGVNYKLRGGTHLTAQYRYTGTEGLEINDVDIDFEAHVIEAGVRVPF